ncbi:MAG: hypothetical protein RL263_1320 [Bacteroidota bacterium]|jgi:hypothetical protein
MNWPIQIKYTKQYGGRMVIITILPIKSKFALAELSFSLDKDCGWPWLRIDCGLNQIFSLVFSVWYFTLEFNFLTKIYKYD